MPYPSPDRARSRAAEIAVLLLAALPTACRGGVIAAGPIGGRPETTVGIVLHPVDEITAGRSTWTDQIESLVREPGARPESTASPSIIDAVFPPLPDRLGEEVVIRAQNGGVFGSLGRLRFDYADDFGDEVRLRGQLMTHITPQLGVDAEAIWYDAAHNDLPRNFWTGDANLVYRIDAGRRMLMRFGGGTSYILRNGDADFGYNLTYATDFYITRPWLVSGELDWGAIGGDKLLHWRVTAGLVWGSLEVYAGYDDYELGPIRFDGPVAGAGLIF